MVGQYQRGKIQKWSQLPESIIGIQHLRHLGAKRGSDYIDQIWGLTEDQVLGQFPSARKKEPTDLEPNTSYLYAEMTTRDSRRRHQKMVWKFLDHRLFQVTLELKRASPGLLGSVQAMLGRAADTRSEEGWSMEVSTWTDGGLLVRGIVDGKSRDFSLAYRDRHEVYSRRAAKGLLAWEANRRGLKRLDKKPYSHKYRRAEKDFLSALKIAPHYGQAQVNLCRLYFYWGYFSHAKSRCKMARNSRTNSVHAQSAYYEGLINMAEGHRRSGLSWLRHVKSYDADNTTPESSAVRHIRLITGRGKRRDFKQAYKEVACAWVERDQKRAKTFAKSYGFKTPQTLGTAARSAGVNHEKMDRWARKKCVRR